MKSETFERVKEIIRNSQNIVFFGGAGVSTASGIPDFRSATGLYSQRGDSRYSPEYMLSHSFFVDHPEEFAENSKRRMALRTKTKPNNAHIALAKLEEQGKLKAIVTQNVDGLHQMAGSKNVIEFHGNSRDFYCVDCKAPYNEDYYMAQEGLPRCEKCGGIVRADIVLYEEAPKSENVSKAIRFISDAEVLIVGGTSLVVYPAAGLLRYYRGNNLILINRDTTPRDAEADYVLRGDISVILWDLVQ